MATTEEKMTTPKYLTTLGWDSSKWTVLKEAEWLPLQKVSGYQTYVYDAVKDPTGREMFGKNARVVKIEWMNKNMASVTEVAPPPAEVDNTPPPPVQEADTTPPPPANVPEEIKEIAKASPNVEIVSVPPVEDKQLPLRKAQMAAIGWTIDTFSELMKKDDKIVSFDGLRNYSDEEFYAMLAAPTKKPEEIEVVEETVVENEWDSFVHTRVDSLLDLRFKKDDKDKELLHASDGELISYEDIDTMENDDWIAYIRLYKSLMSAAPGKEKELREVLKKKAIEADAEKERMSAKKIEDQRTKDQEDRDRVATEASDKLQKDAEETSQKLTDEGASEKAKAEEAINAVKDNQSGEDLDKRMEYFLEKGFEVDSSDGDRPFLHLADMKLLLDEISDMDKKEWIACKKKYSAKKIEKRKADHDEYEDQLKASQSIVDNPEDDEKNEALIRDHEARSGKGEHKVSVESTMTTGDTGGFFSQLATLGFGSAILQMSKDENGEITVRFNIKDTDETCSSESVIFKDIVGTPEELDKIFMDRISQPFKKV